MRETTEEYWERVRKENPPGRPIKFRAWDKQLKEMHNNAFSVNGGGGGVIDAGWKAWSNKHRKAIGGTDCELMQYTGLHDKNGVEIYEGDIVNLIPQGYAVVPAVVQWSDKELRWVSYRPETGTGMHLTADSDFEVIGNIYEGVRNEAN